MEINGVECSTLIPARVPREPEVNWIRARSSRGETFLKHMIAEGRHAMLEELDVLNQRDGCSSLTT